MSLASKYDPVQIEDKWYKIWQEKGFFNSKPNPDKEPFTIVIPPPNVTGVLHMGHMLNNTIQDILTRRARMQGKEACWIPGTDHASIATEAKVVAMLKEKGIDKESLSREEFLKYAWEWKDKYGGIILEQLKKLGASCDWKRTKFTMDEDLSKSVISVFIDLYEKGHIYRGIRMVNWDPEGKTALADDEVIYREVDSQLYYIKYKIKETSDSLIIATTRPETLLGDTAVCIHPNDNRFKKYKGKKAIIPLVNREVPIIEDEYVDMEFGTGCLKVTPSHDENDYKLGQKHNLESIDIFDDEGKINNNGILYTGKDRFKVRKQIIKDLDKIGQLKKVENYKNKKQSPRPYLIKISIHETLISRSICLLWARSPATHTSASGTHPAQRITGLPTHQALGGLLMLMCVSLVILALRRHMLLEMRVSWMLILLR